MSNFYLFSFLRIFAKSTSLFYHITKKEVKESNLEDVTVDSVEKEEVEEFDSGSLYNHNAVAATESFSETELEEFKEDSDHDFHGNDNTETVVEDVEELTTMEVSYYKFHFFRCNEQVCRISGKEFRISMSFHIHMN